MCDFKGCASPPEFHPVIVFHTPGHGFSRCIVGLKVCLVCKSRIKKASDCLGDPEPIRKSLQADDSERIEFIRLTSADAKRLVEMGRRV